MAKQQCAYLNPEGKRCKTAETTLYAVFLDAVMYGRLKPPSDDVPKMWVAVPLCAKHTKMASPHGLDPVEEVEA